MWFYLGVGQGVDDVAEGEEGAVDVGTLPLPRPPGVGGARPLGARQVDKAQLGDAHVGVEAG